MGSERFKLTRADGGSDTEEEVIIGYERAW